MAHMTTTAEVLEGPGWTASDDTFGARLALVRQRKGWGNVKEAAMACGLPVQSWRGWERDNRIPRDVLAIAEQIAAASGCSYQWLVHGTARATLADAPSARSSTDRASDYGSEGSQILTLIPGGLSSDQTPSPSPCRLSLITHSG